MAKGRQPREGSSAASSFAQWGPAIGGIGTLLGGIAAIVAIVVSQPRAGGPANPADPTELVSPVAVVSASPSAAASSSPVASPAAPSAPPFDTVIFESALDAAAPGMGRHTVQSCRYDVSPAGYAISIDLAGRICATPLKPVAGVLAWLVDVSMEVTARFTEVTVNPDSPYGAGDATLGCRMNGPASTGDYYAVSISPIGYWLVDRIDDGTQRHLDYGTAPQIASSQGQPRRMRIDCFGPPDGPTTIRLWVDGAIIGQATDPVGLPAGTLAIAAANYEGPSVTVTYADLTVAKP